MRERIANLCQKDAEWESKFQEARQEWRDAMNVCQAENAKLRKLLAKLCQCDAKEGYTCLMHHELATIDKGE